MQIYKESNYSSPPEELISRPAQSSDEFSIGLQAFQEAIDRFDETKNVSFLYFAGLVINRRVIEYIRKSNRSYAEYPFTYFEADESEGCIEKYAAEQPRVFTDKLEIQEELIQFRQDLAASDRRAPVCVQPAPQDH